MFLIFTLLLPIASILGLLHGANLYASIGELTYFTGILIYFALRHYLDKESFQKSLLFVFTLVLIFVIVRNFYNYQEIILQAYLPWQVEKARVTSNEVLILFFTTLCTSSFVYSKNLKQTVFSLLFLGGGFLSLILTQSRGYWLAFLISFSVVFIFVSAKKKNRMVLYFSIILALTLGIAKIYFSDFFDLIFNAILIRFESISTSAQVDISLLERFQESATVFSKIAINPILGYGFGTEYVKFIFFERIHISTSYIHNGYLAAWYKLGLPGLLILLGICVSIFRNSFRIFKNSELLINKVLGLTIMATLAGMMLVNNTSPQFLALDSIVLLTVMGAYCSEFSQSKYMRSSRS
jgi:O-antigen ligase